MSDASVKIQARNEYFINPTIPTRDDVRKANYVRRETQLNFEGFSSKLWKPYICIGHPLELDKCLEISDLPDHKEHLEKQEDIEVNKDKVAQIDTDNNRASTSAQSLRKCSQKMEELNKNLKKEINKSEMLTFNVRTGQNFFDILKKENEKKFITDDKSEQPMIKAMPEIRPAIEDSDSESGSELQFSDNKEFSSRPSTGISRKKLNIRPFTPIYSNISNLTNKTIIRPKSEYGYKEGRASTQMSLNSETIEQESLFRQLTSLQWLLEAMINENVENMSRISLSWITRKENNNLTSSKNKKEIKVAWEKYITKSDQQSRNRITISGPLSTQAMKPANTNQMSKTKETNEINVNTSLQLSKESYQKISVKEIPSNSLGNICSSRPKSAVGLQRRRMIAEVRSVCEEIAKNNNDYEYKKNLHLMRIGRFPIDRKRISESTKLLPEDQYSDKLQHMLSKHHDQSSQMIEEKLNNLRDNIRNMSEYKLIICSNKYKDIQTKGEFHQMLKNFRGKNTYQNFFKVLDQSKNKIIYTNWFLSLEENLKTNYENKRIEKALEKIRPFALNTITKLNKKRLFSVLKYLSDWEIRHPDISAGIKFVTDHVVSISEEEYQIWFRQNFN